MVETAQRGARGGPEITGDVGHEKQEHDGPSATGKEVRAVSSFAVTRTISLNTRTHTLSLSHKDDFVEPI